MERRNFIRLAGFTTLGLIVGNNIFASNYKMRSNELIEIEPPNVHVRHGFFNVHKNEQNKLYIQRDIFNKNGLEAISDDRITSIKISYENINSFGIIDKEGINGHSKKIKSIPLKAKEISKMKIDSPCLIFSEFDDFTIDGSFVSSNQAIQFYEVGLIDLSSKCNQHIIIYSI